jgi:hypothetical protein
MKIILWISLKKIKKETWKNRKFRIVYFSNCMYFVITYLSSFSEFSSLLTLFKSSYFSIKGKMIFNIKMDNVEVLDLVSYSFSLFAVWRKFGKKLLYARSGNFL